MELEVLAPVIGSGVVLAVGGVVGNAAWAMVKKGWAALAARQQAAARRQESSAEVKALELATDNQRLLVWIGSALLAMLTVGMLVLAELFLCLIMLNPDRVTWGCWLGALLALVVSLLGFRMGTVLEKVQDALNTAP